MSETFDVVVIGAGQAGLSVSQELKLLGIDHIILERGRIGETWRGQRWDAFCLNTPNWSNNLSGLEIAPDMPDLFPTKDQLVHYLAQYAAQFHLPVQEHAKVTAVKTTPTGLYTIDVDGAQLNAKAVVLASGGMSRSQPPPMANHLSGQYLSLTAASYKRADELPDGAVLVVGSGQSGCQIVENLLRSDRRVYLATSRVGRVPRRYRGKDFMTWWKEMGLWEQHVDHLEDPRLPFVTHPMVSGDEGGQTISFQSLASGGVVLLGRLETVDRHKISLKSNLLDSIAYSNQRSQDYKTAIDEHILSHQLDAPDAELDPGEPPLPNLQGSDRIEELDLEREGISCVIWCTGFDADWSWLEPCLLNEQGHPMHHLGIAATQGLYCVGMPWLAKRKSGILLGVPEDAARVVDHLAAHLL